MDHGGCPYDHLVRGERVLGRSEPTEADTETRRIQQRRLGSCEIGPKVGLERGLVVVRQGLRECQVFERVAHTYHVWCCQVQSQGGSGQAFPVYVETRGEKQLHQWIRQARRVLQTAIKVFELGGRVAEEDFLETTNSRPAKTKQADHVAEGQPDAMGELIRGPSLP